MLYAKHLITNYLLNLHIYSVSGPSGQFVNKETETRQVKAPSLRTKREPGLTAIFKKPPQLYAPKPSSTLSKYSQYGELKM